VNEVIVDAPHFVNAWLEIDTFVSAIVVILFSIYLVDIKKDRPHNPE
jgi:sugar phosphate permease